MHPPCVWADELRWTLETLDRVAAGLFRAARRCHHSLAGPDEATGEIVAAIQKAAANLRQGYARLANGSPAAELDAEAALAGKEGLAGSRAGTLAGRGGALLRGARRLGPLALLPQPPLAVIRFKHEKRENPLRNARDRHRAGGSHVIGR